MSETTGKDIFNSAKQLYQDVLQKGQTFSYDIGQMIEEELKKMQKQKEEWLKKKAEEETKEEDSI